MLAHPRVGDHQGSKFIVRTRDTQRRTGEDCRTKGTLLGDDLHFDAVWLIGLRWLWSVEFRRRQAAHVRPELLHHGIAVVSGDTEFHVITGEGVFIVRLDIIQADGRNGGRGAFNQVRHVSATEQQVLQRKLAVILVR